MTQSKAELSTEDKMILDLIEGPCEVVFTKANKEVRTMVCTLMDEYIGIESAGESPPTPGLITVWDIDKDAWRRFKVDSVISFERLA